MTYTNHKNEWIDQEIKDIYCDRKYMKIYQKPIVMIKLMFMLAIVFFCTIELNGARLKHRNVCSSLETVDGGHKQFYCSKCEVNVWHDKNNADWQGKYYCPSCKTYLGK